MKKLLLTTAALIALAVPASAIEAVCDAPVVYKGKEFFGDKNRTTEVRIKYNPESRTWEVIHVKLKGDSVNRKNRYAIVDVSRKLPTKSFSWKGVDRENPDFSMEGELVTEESGNKFYYEWIINNEDNKNETVANLGTFCVTKDQR